MRTDHLITPEEKLSKQQHIEQNRRIRSAQKSPCKTRCAPVGNKVDDLYYTLFSL